MRYRVGDRVKIFSLEKYIKIKGDNLNLVLIIFLFRSFFMIMFGVLMNIL